MRHFKTIGLLLCACLVWQSCDNDPVTPVLNPSIEAITPMEGNPGMNVTIMGKDFDPNNVVVRFGNTPALAYYVDLLRIGVRVPEGATDGPITVVSGGNELVFPHDFKVTPTAPPSKHTITIHPNGRVASMLLEKKEFQAFNTSQNGYWHETIADFYTKFNDEFDFIFLVHNNRTDPPNMPAAFMAPVSNSVVGTGQGIFDNTSAFGSAGKLKSVFSFLAFSEYEISSVGLHEVMHTWGNWAFYAETWNSQQQLGEDAGAHWGFSGCGGALGGFIQSTLTNNVDGDPNTYMFMESPMTLYSNFELYLGGFIPASDLTPFDVLTDITSFDDYKLTAKTREKYDRTRIEEELGVRSPDFITSQKSFRALVVVLTPLPLTDEEWDKINRDADKFFMTSDDGTLENNFWEATGGKGEILIDGLYGVLK